MPYSAKMNGKRMIIARGCNQLRGQLHPEQPKRCLQGAGTVSKAQKYRIESVKTYDRAIQQAVNLRELKSCLSRVGLVTLNR
jgi:hypothetical protein